MNNLTTQDKISIRLSNQAQRPLLDGLEPIIVPEPITDEILMPEEPSVDDEVRCCPDCERPNQFGELCPTCEREIREEDDANGFDPEIDAPGSQPAAIANRGYRR